MRGKNKLEPRTIAGFLVLIIGLSAVGIGMAGMMGFSPISTIGTIRSATTIVQGQPYVLVWDGSFANPSAQRTINAWIGGTSVQTLITNEIGISSSGWTIVVHTENLAAGTYTLYLNMSDSASESAQTSMQLTILAPSTPSQPLKSAIHETSSDAQWQRQYSSNSFRLIIYNDAKFEDTFYLMLNGAKGSPESIMSGNWQFLYVSAPNIQQGTPFQIYSAITGQMVMNGTVSGMDINGKPVNTTQNTDLKTTNGNTVIMGSNGTVNASLENILIFAVGAMMCFIGGFLVTKASNRMGRRR